MDHQPSHARDRRSTRFRALVEPLDARRLLAAGVTGQVYEWAAVAGQSVADTNVDFFGLPSNDGSIPLVRLSDTAGALSAAGVVASVDYGDGTPIQAGTVTVFNQAIGAITGNLLINGPSHTYEAPGTYTITVAVVEPGDSAPTIFRDSITAQPPQIDLTAQLDNFLTVLPSPSFLSTPDRAPRFSGTAPAGSSVVVAAANLSTGSTPFALGTAVADAAGHWSLTSTPLVDGRYAVTATTTGPFGATAAVGLAGPGTPEAYLAVDGGGPRITAARITDARKGAFSITFSDPYGLNTYALTQPSSYVVARTSPAPRKGQQPLAVADLATSFTPDALRASADVPVVVTGKLAASRGPLPRNAVYTLTIPSTQITGVSTSPLDGEFNGRFPTGDGTSGGDFRVKITVRNGKVAGLAPVNPPKATHAARPKATATQHHA